MFKIGLERISLGGQTGASNSLALSRGADSITIRWTEAGGVTTVFDSEGATPVNITGEGTVWLKMTVKPNGAIKTEYSIVGDSSYNTLSDNSSGGVVTAAKPKFTLSSSSTPGFSSSTSVSMVEWKVFGGYHTSGFVVSDAVTAGDTIIAGMLNYTATTPASTSISALATSADNGANYEAHTLNTFHNFTDQGTQLKTKITLASSDNTATPILQFYGYQWTEGE